MAETATIDPPPKTGSIPESYTTQFRVAFKQTTQNLLEMARVAGEVHGEYGYKAYVAWLDSEFELSESTAKNLLNIHSNILTANFAVNDIESIAPSALYLLAAPSTPAAAREEVVESAKSGKRVTHKDAKAVVAKHGGGKTRGKRTDKPKPAPAETPPAPPPPSTPEPDEPEIDELEAALRDAPATEDQKQAWAGYNAKCQRLVELATEAAKVMDSILAPEKGDQDYEFTEWMNRESWRGVFSNTVAEFSQRRIANLTSTPLPSMFGGTRNFLYVFEVVAANAKKKNKKGGGK